MIAKILTSLNMKSDLQGLFTISNELILEFRKDFGSLITVFKNREIYSFLQNLL